MKFKPTAADRREHVERMQGFARAIADKLDASNDLADWERDFMAFVASERGDSSPSSLRAWADEYKPYRPPGQPPLYCHADAALAYVAERANGRTHYKAILWLHKETGVKENALERAIWPIIPDACEHLGVPVETALWRKDRPPKK